MVVATYATTSDAEEEKDHIKLLKGEVSSNHLGLEW